MNTPTNLLILEAGGGYEIFEEEIFETISLERKPAEEVIIISGTITVSP